MKRGQVSIFIIVTIVILISIGIIVVLKNPNLINSTPSSLKTEISLIDSQLDVCLKQRAIDAIRITGLQGGYINLPKDYLITNISNIAYGYYLGKNTLPKKEFIENEISSYIQSSSVYCIDETNFPELNVSKEPSSSTANINKNDISISVKMPVSVTKSNYTFKLDKSYEYKFPIKLGDIINTANSIIQKEIAEPDNIPLSYLAQLKYNILTLKSDNDLVYAIVDLSSESRIDNVSYSFLFANKFEVKNESL